MGHFHKSGQANITNGKLGTTTNYSLGSTGTTKYNLNPNGATVTTHYTLGGTPFTKTLRAGETIQHNWQLGPTGTTSYNMGAGNSKTLKYTLDPGGDVIESNGRLSGKTGTASYTLGAGSSSQVSATLGSGSTQSYTLGEGGSATINMVTVDGPISVTLGPGDSSSTTISYGADAELLCSSTYDPDHPPQETMEYAVGDDGSTDNSFGGETWQVWLFQPYNVKEKTDYTPICVVMPAGEYNPGCPGRLPSFIQSNGDYPAGTNCRYILVGSAHRNGQGTWVVTQNAIGTLTFPSEDKDVYNPPVLPTPYINQYEVAVQTLDIDGMGTVVLKVGRGGNIWNASTTELKHSLEKRVDVITTGVGVNPVVTGSDTASPWASDDGYVVLHGINTYVYAFKITYNQGANTDFYIFVSESDELAPSNAPIGIPSGIPTPSGDYKVDAVKIADVLWNGTGVGADVFTVSQRVVGAITWPDYIPPAILQQFQVVVAPQNDEVIDPDSIQIVKGDVIWNNSRWQNNPPPSSGAFTPTLQGNAKKVWVYPSGSLTEGSDYNSPFVNNGGRFHLERTSVYGVYIIGNQDSTAAGSSYGNVTLAIIADGSEAYTKSRPFAAGYMGRNWISAYVAQDLFTVDGSPYAQYFFDSNWLWNYNCQRYLVAKVYWNEVQWVVEQRMYGPVTLSNDLIFDGGRFMPSVSPGESWPFSYADEQADWEGVWAGYTKDGNPDDCTVIFRPYP